MVKYKKRQFLKEYGWLITISLILLLSLTAMSQVLHSPEQFAKFYVLLLFLSFAGISALLVMLFSTLNRLRKSYKKKRAGSIITTKLTLSISLIIIIPLIITYVFSVKFVNQGIGQWFDVKTEQALSDAVRLVRISLDNQRRNHLRSTLQAATVYQLELATNPVLTIINIRNQFNMKEAALYNANGRLIAFSSGTTYINLPVPPRNTLFQQIRQNRTYSAIETMEGVHNDFQVIRVMVPVINPINNNVYALHALYSIPDQLSQLAKNVQTSARQYKELSYLKQPLKTSFTVMLTVLLLLTLISTLLFTIKIIKSLIKPIETLAKGTQAVALGDYSVIMPVIRDDDLGQLTTSFNNMIKQIAFTRNEIKFSHQQTKVQQLYLQTIIQNLNSGVITLDMNLCLKTVNDAANAILNVNFFKQLSKPLKEILNLKKYSHAKLLFNDILSLFTNDTKSWSKQFTFDNLEGQKILLIHGSTSPSLDKDHGGFVIVIEDITQLIQAQLHAAWQDVAKRLAHEIKNPLTPILLSAERLNYKLAKKISAEDEVFLNRMTQTITNQVLAMQQLVQAFTEYADSPKLEISALQINKLILDVAEMYYDKSATWQVITELDEQCKIIYADAAKIRQLLHNLIKNAIEAEEEGKDNLITISTKLLEKKIQICITDTGAGISETAKNWIFEPYATGKPKGTGLGLAIVKKIVDEHNGQIKVESIYNANNNNQQGTIFSIVLPIQSMTIEGV